jgi:hypothetical protein
MANMSLGAYVFAKNPSAIPSQIQKGKDVAFVKTYDGVAVFVFDEMFAGETIQLSWLLMSTTQYAELLTLYLAGNPVSFNPQDGTTKTYSVVIQDLNGEYFIHMANASGNYRRSVEMTLIVIDQE